MANLAIYEKALGLSQCEDILEDFQKTLSETNRNSKFFVDWQKIIHNVENIHIQLNILNAVLCSTTAKEAEETFVKLTKKYPEVIEVLPLLLAIREQKIIVNNDFSDKIPKLEAISISFRQDVVQNEIDFQILIEFLRSAGVFKLFADPKIHDLVEYVFGVEVGLDTHTRKNRSGIIMQFTLEPQLKKLVEERQLHFKSQFSQTDAQKNELDWPLSRDRQMDFAIWAAKKTGPPICIEANYFGVSGSKAGVAASYIERQNELKRNNCEFVLITDGPGWKQMKNDLKELIQKLDFIINLSHLRRGMFAAILDTLYPGG